MRNLRLIPDHRFLAGDAELYRQFESKFAQFRSRRGASIAKQLTLLAEDRRSKFPEIQFII